MRGYSRAALQYIVSGRERICTVPQSSRFVCPVPERRYPILLGIPMITVSDALRELAEPRPRGDKIDVTIMRAAKLAGLSYWRAYEFWYRKAVSLDDIERNNIAEALVRKRREQAQNELQELRNAIARLETLLVKRPAGDHSNDVAAVRGQLRADGRERLNNNRTVALSDK